MSDEVTLREYFERRLQDIESARKVALASMDKRLDAMNEFREALRDAQGTFVTRDVNDMEHKAIEKQIATLMEDKARTEGKALRAQIWGAVAVGIALIGLLLDLFGFQKV